LTFLHILTILDFPDVSHTLLLQSLGETGGLSSPPDLHKTGQNCQKRDKRD